MEILQDNDNDERLLLNFLPDIPNDPVNDISQEEPILIISSDDNRELPKVFATRENFPVGLPHTNITKNQRPVSLCIFEDEFEELKHQWSGSYFLKSIKNWLELTARNELHQEDQPLEPFIIGSKGVIINPNHLYIKKISSGYYKTTDRPLGRPMRILSITTKPIENGVVHQKIDNLYSLSELFTAQNIDLLALIKPKVIELVDFGVSKIIEGDFWKSIIFLIVEIPISKGPKRVEPTIVGFKINATLRELSSIFGRKIVSHNAIFDMQSDHSKDRLTSIGIEILNPHLGLNKTFAQLYSGIDTKWSDFKFSLIGVGALGSQFFMNLARSGFGRWNLIDGDILLPHNFVRHASTNIESHITTNKARAISNQANTLLCDQDFSKAITKKIYEVERSILLESDAIIDMSTAIGVERYLANELKGVRKFSSFLNPAGSDLIMLSEDIKAHYPLDILEIQYYKEILVNPDFANHLSFIEEGKIRYARGCRDITSKVPQENLAIFSGIAVKSFKNKLNESDASINIWRIDEYNSVIHHSFEIDNWVEEKIDNWSVFFNESILEQISDFRMDKLPNETGGILIGTIDNFYKKVYLASTILAPEDSIERPTLFIRGIKGVSEKLEIIREVTNNNLKYLGEWHSHPKNCGLGMSCDDKIQFAELLTEAKLNGQPALMCIFGDDKKYRIYFDNYEI